MSSKHKFDLSVFFEDPRGVRRFLFRVLNIGKGDLDDLKFVFLPPVKNIGITYGEHPEGYSSKDLPGSYGEITYHSDGSMLHKLTPFEKIQPGPVYKNPMGQGNRRSPISGIREWEPIIRLTIRDYENCKIVEAEKMAVFPRRTFLFNEEPFVCDLFLGHESNPDPLNMQLYSELVFRIPGIAAGVDLVCWVYKTLSWGRWMRLGENSDKAFYFRLNEIQALEWKKGFQPGWRTQSDQENSPE